jgi:hypothetical protein
VVPGVAGVEVVEVVVVDFASPALSLALSLALSAVADFGVSLSLSPGPLVLAMTGVTISPKASKDAANPRIPSSLKLTTVLEIEPVPHQILPNTSHLAGRHFGSPEFHFDHRLRPCKGI